MRHLERRLRALEQRAPAARADGMTVAEWVQWRSTGEQPERWLSSPTAQATVAAMLARSEAVDRMMQEFEGYE